MALKSPIRVLLVEDDARDATLVEDLLRREGFILEAKRVDNEADFSRALNHFHPDLILSDNCLTHFAGSKALALAREKSPGVPFIFFTSAHGEESAIQAFQGGATDYVLKNRLEELAPAVQRALDNSEELARRRATEEELRHSEASFRMLVENIKDYAIYRLDARGRVASWNEGAERLEGYAANEIIGRHFSIFFTPEDAAAGKPAHILKVAGEEGRFEDEGWRVRKDGSRFWSEVVCTAMRDSSGRLTGFSKVAHDVTERKKAEEKLKAHICQQAVVAELGQRAVLADDFQAFMEEAVNLVAQTCAVEYGVVLELQPKRKEFLLRAGVGWRHGYVGKATVPVGAETLAGYALLADGPVIVEDLLEEKRFSGARLLQEHGVRSGLNVIIRQREGPFGVLGIYSTTRRSFSGEDIHFVRAVANILSAMLERQRTQEQLEIFNEELEQQVARRTEQLQAANKELESFSYSVSHDLRTPLRHIGGFIEMLQRTAQGKLDESSQTMIQVISESAKKMDDLINDLLTFSRMGCSEMRQIRVNMRDVVEKARGELAAEMQGRKVVWSIAPLPEVTADLALLRQAWMNLISNALKYTRKCDEARIEIGARAEDQEWIFWIKDNGVGFDPHYAHKLFGVFQRLHPARDFEGTGIGLAIVRRIIARHGGRTWAESAAGQGATFYFSLPKNGSG